MQRKSTENGPRRFRSPGRSGLRNENRAIWAGQEVIEGLTGAHPVSSPSMILEGRSRIGCAKPQALANRPARPHFHFFIRHLGWPLVHLASSICPYIMHECGVIFSAAKVRCTSLQRAGSLMKQTSATTSIMGHPQVLPNHPPVRGHSTWSVSSPFLFVIDASVSLNRRLLKTR